MKLYQAKGQIVNIITLKFALLLSQFIIMSLVLEEKIEMSKRKEISPGDKRAVSFPLDIDKEFLDYLNSQNNFSGTLINLAIKGYKSKKIENLEKRIENLENVINKKSDSAAAKKNCSFSLDSFNKQSSF